MAVSTRTRDRRPDQGLHKGFVEGEQAIAEAAAVPSEGLAESEIAEYRKFVELTDDLVDMNRKICRLRPVEQSQQTAQEKKRRKSSSKKSPAK